MAKKVQKGYLTPRQKRILEVLVACPEFTKAEVAQACKVSAPYVSKLITQHEDFKEALDKRLKEEWSDARRNAQKQMINMSNNGDFQATKYILDTNGYQAPQDINLNTDVIRVTIDE